MFHRIALCLFLLCGFAAHSQNIFIPDTVLRAAMNVSKPNSVDANGMCDTAAWNAQPPSSVNVDVNLVPDSGTVDLEGIQYLKLGALNVQKGFYNHVSIHWPGYPLNITSLSLSIVDASLFTGAFLPLPPTLDRFNCQKCGLGTLPPFSGTFMFLNLEDLGGQTLNVPSSVTTLIMNACGLTQLPLMPNVLQLNVNDNPLGSLPTIPPGLKRLYVNNTGLTSLPTLPPGLVYLSVSGNSITALPPLPSTLQHIVARGNQLTALPPLPAWLNTLDVSFNPLPVLPPINFVSDLNVASCGMSTINLPNGVGHSLNASNNPITSLPILGNGMQSIKLENCSSLTCLPPLPPLLQTLVLTGSAVTCLPNIPATLNPDSLGIPVVVCNVANSSCPPAYPVITGTTFQDSDNNGTFDSFEPVRSNSLVVAQPGDLLTASDMNGYYVMPADIGSFSVTGVSGLYEPVTTAPYAVTIGGIAQVASLNDVGFLVISGMRDLVTNLIGNNVRPGFNTTLWVHVENVGTEPTDAAVQLTFDPSLSYLNSTIAPQTINTNVLDWTMPVIQPGATWSVRVDLYAPPSLALGTPVVQAATATPSQTDQTPLDNTAVLNDMVVGSFDPNDKRVEPELLMLQDITTGTRVNYTIRFQNTGTFPAERVLITDTLPAGVRPATMQFTGTSHACTWYIQHRVLHVLYNNINLPDSTNDEANSHGYVRFTMQPSTDLIIGDAVENVANIYFDFNEPVITEPAIFYVETGTSVQERDDREVHTWPNPVTGQLMVEFAPGVPTEALSVVDLQGRVVLQFLGVPGDRQMVDVSGIAAGTYLLKARTPTDIISTRFVKQ